MKIYKGLQVREDAYDEYIVDEMRTYEYLGVLGGTVLDIGANIGAFARYVLEKGAEHVICVEPDPENFELLLKNTRPWATADVTITMVQAAVTSSGLDKVDLWLNQGSNKGLHSTVPRRGREPVRVDALDFRSLIRDSSAKTVKVDIEGAEYALDWLELPDHVKHVAVELHLTRRDWRREKAPRLLDEIMNQGFELVNWDRLEVPEKSWTRLYIWRRY